MSPHHLVPSLPWPLTGLAWKFGVDFLRDEGIHPLLPPLPVPAVPRPGLFVLHPLSPKVQLSPPGGPQGLPPRGEPPPLHNPPHIPISSSVLIPLQDRGVLRGFITFLSRFNSGVSQRLLGPRDWTQELDIVMPSLGLGDRESWKMFNWGGGPCLP